jgi:methionine-rich copper-binding protein CopC
MSLAFAAGLVIFGPTGAIAHAILMASVPAPEGRVTAGALAIELRFNSLIDVKRSRLALIDARQQEVRLPIVGGGNGDLMAARVVVTPGAYVLRWQVLAVDGHITRGDVDFQAAPPPGSVPSVANPVR